MKANIQQIQEIVSVLSNDEQQLLKDTINNGFWGDCDCEFLKEDGTEETVVLMGIALMMLKMQVILKDISFLPCSVLFIRNFVRGKETE